MTDGMISPHDRSVLRGCAKQVAEIAALPIQEERRELWRRHNSLRTTRPLILVFPEGSWPELLREEDLACQGEEARCIERALRERIYYHEYFQDDTVIENSWIVHKTIHNSGWGLEARRIPSTTARGSWGFEPVLTEPSDLKQLRFPEIAYDEQATMEELRRAEELFGDILEVRLKGVDRVSYHLMQQYTGWRGLAETMRDVRKDPQMVHDVMGFLLEGHSRVMQQYVDQNLLSLNNDGTYNSSGGNGYTEELPQSGFVTGQVRKRDMWACAESQELAPVSPEDHAEFALRYERQLLAPFGLTGYGCCEDLTDKLDDVFAIPNIRRISISPFADVDVCAERLGGGYVYSWKPHPAHLVGDFDEDMIREYVRHTIEVAQVHGCVLEIVLKDTHTCEHHPERFDSWTKIATEEVSRVG